MKRLLVIAFFVLIALYALFQARFLILGPRVSIDTPRDNSAVDAGTITISGTAKNVSFLSLDDRRIYTDKDGHWQEKLVMQKGVNIIKLTAKDRFGRETEKLLRVVVN